MKLQSLILCFLVCAFQSRSQSMSAYAAIDRIALSIPSSQANSTSDIASYIKSHFKKGEEKVRAAFTWVATNIRYDAAHLHWVVLNEDHEERVTWAMERKKGVCENFAAIFTDICLKSGLRAFFVEGYTRTNGSMDRSGHAWSAVSIDNKWYLYDPTWDAGFNSNGIFVNRTASNYFQVAPATFIETHMPFDPIFQFLNYPISFDDFSKGFTKARNQLSFFNYTDSIVAYEKLNPLSKYTNAAIRIEKNGSPTQMTSTKLKQLRMEKEIIYQEEDADLYNSAIEDYKQAIGNFKTYLNYRNNQFLPERPYAETETMLDEIIQQISVASKKLSRVNETKATLALNTGDVEKVLNDLAAKVEAEKIFLRNYFSLTGQK